MAMRGGDVAGEEGEAGPGGERAGVWADRHDRVAGVARQVGGDRVVPARGEHVHQRRQDEEDADEGRDPACGVAGDCAEAEAEQSDEGQVEGAADDRACDARVGDREGDVVAVQGVAR